MALDIISNGNLKLHHLGIGGLISILSLFVTNFTLTNYGLSDEWLVLINFGVLVVPTILGIHHKRNGNHIRHSTRVCFTLGHGIVFTMILNYFQQGILPIILENVNQIR